MVFKLLVGAGIGSVSVISEAIHSGVDLVAAVIALLAVRSADKPADKEHPYGHGKIENISGFLEALLIAAAAAWIIIAAIGKFQHPRPMQQLGWGVAVMFVSALANLFISRMLFKVGKEMDSIALQADGCHLRTDVYTSAGVMAGLALMAIIRWLFKVECSWLDPAAAIVVSCLIFKAAYELTLQSIRDLLDASLPPEEEEWIRDYIGRLQPTIRGFHRLRTRKSGSTRFVELHLIVEADMSVEDAHRISEVLTCDIEDRFPLTSVSVHIEPCDGTCEEICVQGCFLSAEERLAQRMKTKG